MKKILVTGANGQLGQCLKKKSKTVKDLEFVFLDSSVLNITNTDQIQLIFGASNFDYCINCAAYTAVDDAEDEPELAKKINVLGVNNLAEACKTYNTTLIHIATDFVFDGINNKPYKEIDDVNPLSVYGSTKLEGEKAISNILDRFYIIRTSWLYSEFGNNFVKTMLRLGNEKDSLNVVNDQFGTPTNANDLASVIVKIINNNKREFGLYHYSNLGETTWYDFAKAVFKYSKIQINLIPVTSTQFITKAKRPKYSVLDKTKISTILGMIILDWKQSLENHIKIIYL